MRLDFVTAASMDGDVLVRMWNSFFAAVVLSSGLLMASSALAQVPPSSLSSQVPATEPTTQSGISLRDRDTLLGDLGGVRASLEDIGIELKAQETSEVLGNITGGVHRGVIYEGATLATLSVDTEKLLGFGGGTFNVSGFQIHGKGLSANNLDNLNVASGIEAKPSTRLFELWYEQSILNGGVSIRIGQQAADQEFAVSQYGGLFVNSGFGWATLTAIDLPSGGPAYPFATPGVRVKVQPTDDLALLVGLYNGDPDDNGSGTSFRVDKGALLIGEVEYSVNSSGTDTGLPGTYKVGAWYNSNSFPDQRFGTDGLSLAEPVSNGVPLLHRGDWGIYALADQMIYRVPGTKDQGLGLFGRIMAAPSDRNQISFYVNAGANYKGMIRGRPDDTAGIGVIYSRIGDTARNLDADTVTVSGNPRPIRDAETVLEVTYQAQITPWWTLQPDFQYVFSPGGGIPDPSRPSKMIGDAAVLGLRATITF
ncbi:carbohydrate porin [Mycobacterium sp. KBS0706]|uniref:carbohydrate porin n=1 Tax=Mycobacterium sp. KBS0706 TaxID=2578109 RepID=UPI00110FA66A|nr:carbohydrate porin [Mycobacterium sp. KBS0706]TSD82976.1 carbohydrate porin [Mycobacterium sp. KBS0706]